MASPIFILHLLCPKGNSPLSNMGRHPLFNPEMILKEIEVYILFRDNSCNHISRIDNKIKQICNRDTTFGFCKNHARFHPFEMKVTQNKKYKSRERLECRIFKYDILFSVVDPRKESLPPSEIDPRKESLPPSGVDRKESLPLKGVDPKEIDQKKIVKTDIIRIRKNYYTKNLKDFYYYDDNMIYYVKKILKITCDFHGDYCPQDYD